MNSDAWQLAAFPAHPQHEVYPEIRRPLHILTRRECEVLQMLADGRATEESVNRSLLVRKQLKPRE